MLFFSYRFVLVVGFSFVFVCLVVVSVSVLTCLVVWMLLVVLNNLCLFVVCYLLG